MVKKIRLVKETANVFDTKKGPGNSPAKKLMGYML